MCLRESERKGKGPRVRWDSEDGGRRDRERQGGRKETECTMTPAEAAGLAVHLWGVCDFE